MHQTRIALPCGTLHLDYQTDEFLLDELLDFALRINPKRAFLFVSKVLGRHIPACPHTMRHAFTHLAHKIPDNLPTPIVVVGMAETAVGLSAGVHLTLKARYCDAILLNSTRHEQDNRLLTTFSEDHSHASRHLLYWSCDDKLNARMLTAQTLIVVDDEASTAQTCANLVNALTQAGLSQLKQVHLATLVDWSLLHTHQVFADKGFEFYRHHLLCGSWQWTPADKPALIQMPDVATTAQGNSLIADLPSFGRTPTTNSTLGFDRLWQKVAPIASQLAQKTVLVLGSNEFVWLPFLLAERLAQNGVAVKFGALTRSPIAMGRAIHSVLSFRDNYGLGMTNFVYNVNFDDYDCIILCIETPTDSVDAIWHHPKVVIVSACG